jgi:DNA repair exonuclease SbcCD nuclease subunit
MPESQIKLLLFADTHLGLDYTHKPRVVRNRRGEDFFANYERVLDYATANDVDLVIHGGDFFSRSTVTSTIIQKAYLPLKEVADQGIPIAIVPGNHEKSRLPEPILLAHKNIYVFDEPKSLYFDIRGTRVVLAGFPYIRGNIRGRLATVIEDTGWAELDSDLRILCMHQAIEGAVVGSHNYRFGRARDVVNSRGVAGDFAALLSGHLHRHQILDYGEGPPVVYPGSIERTSIAEINEQKGFCVLTFTDDESGQLVMADCEFMGLPARPMHDIRLDGIELYSDQLLEHLLEQINSFEADAIVRVRAEKDVPQDLLTRMPKESMLRKLVPPGMNITVSGRYPRKEYVTGTGGAYTSIDDID